MNTTILKGNKDSVDLKKKIRMSMTIHLTRRSKEKGKNIVMSYCTVQNIVGSVIIKTWVITRRQLG